MTNWQLSYIMRYFWCHENFLCILLVELLCEWSKGMGIWRHRWWNIEDPMFLKCCEGMNVVEFWCSGTINVVYTRCWKPNMVDGKFVGICCELCESIFAFLETLMLKMELT
jgi:hypothetical protein